MQPADAPAPPNNRQRGSRSQRRMTLGRRLTYALAVPFGMGLIRFFWTTCRVSRVIGAGSFEHRALNLEPSIVCYWHRHQLFCWRYLRRLIDRGARIGWLISASVDGAVPSGIAERMGGGVVFRGSTTSGGSEALRGMYKGIVKDKRSMAATPDGPRGPRSEFKPGMVRLAQLTGVPLVPMAYAARHAWVLRTWDRFVIPRPFTRIVVAVGEPVFIARDASDEDIFTIQKTMEQRLETLFQTAKREVN